MMMVSSSYKPAETLTTLYTRDELQNWESYQKLPSFQHSQHQRLLNVLYDEDSCSYGGRSTMAGLNLEDLKKHIQEGSEAVLASINPFGPLVREIEYMKTFLSTTLFIEYSVLAISVVISAVLYGVTAMLGVLITRLTLNWARLKIRSLERIRSN